MTRHYKDRPELIVSVIEDFRAEYGHPPSVRNIVERVGLAGPSGVHHHLQLLAKAGRVEQCRCGCGRWSEVQP